MKINLEFIRKLAFVSKFAATKDLRFYLNGVNLESDGENIWIIGTDGVMLCHSKVELKTNETFNLILPIDQVNDLFKSKQITEYSELTINEKWVTVKNKLSEVTIRTIEGKYPDWRKTIPKVDREVKIDKGIGFKLDHVVKINDAFKFANKYFTVKKEKVLAFRFGSEFESILIDLPTIDLLDTQIVMMPYKL